MIKFNKSIYDIDSVTFAMKQFAKLCSTNMSEDDMYIYIDVIKSKYDVVKTENEMINYVINICGSKL